MSYIFIHEILYFSGLAMVRKKVYLCWFCRYWKEKKTSIRELRYFIRCFLRDLATEKIKQRHENHILVIFLIQ